MKKLISLVIPLAIFTLFACSKQEAEKIPDPSQGMLLKADSAITFLGKTLKSNLLKKLNESGIDSAIHFCSVNAMALTQMSSQKLNGMLLKRTSKRYRNPLNAPDSLEELALDHFSNLLKNDQPVPAYFVQKYLQNGIATYRYYKPLKTAALCLHCHGMKDKMKPSIVQLIHNRYPSDKATGYNEGEFRGLMRVEFSLK